MRLVHVKEINPNTFTAHVQEERDAFVDVDRMGKLYLVEDRVSSTHLIKIEMVGIREILIPTAVPLDQPGGGGHALERLAHAAESFGRGEDLPRFKSPLPETLL